MHEIYRILRRYVEAVRRPDQEEGAERVCERISQELYERFRPTISEMFMLPEVLREMRETRDHQVWLLRQTLASNDAVSKQLQALAESPQPFCALRESEGEGGYTKLIISGGPSLAANSGGKREHDAHLREWLDDAVEVIAIDPFLFKRERGNGKHESDEERDHLNHAYADALLDVVGSDRVVSFIYRGNPSKDEGGPIKVTQGVANRIADRLGELALKANFYVVEDLHDRVWLKKKKSNVWSGRVIGTSRGGIGSRPTYMIDMSDDDIGDYWPYVEHLKRSAQLSHERPIDFKKAPPKKTSNSGKTRIVRKAPAA